jgi:predicted alpha/beta-fold hydrolase
MNTDQLSPLTLGYEFHPSEYSDFTPEEPYQAPFWFLNGHGHTIIRNFTGSTRWPDYTRVELSTPDGDFLDLDLTEPEPSNGKPEARGTVLLLHGLEGDSQRYYIAELAWQLRSAGFRVVAMNFRGCSGRVNKNRRLYHSGETSDPHFVLRWMKDQWPEQALFGVGFSLGGNVLAKLLGELGENQLLSAAVPVSAPFNLSLGADVINQGFNRVYQQRFMVSLKQKLKQKQRQFSDLPDFSGSTFWEFDDQVTAPLHGFSGAEDYYRKSSAAQFVSDIRTPTLVIHSKQDPICPFEGVPTDAIDNNPWISALYTEEGGHVAFGSSPNGWINRVIRHFFLHEA